MQAPSGVKTIVPPFNLETALKKVQMAEDASNSRDPERVLLPIAWIRNGATGPNSLWVGLHRNGFRKAVVALYGVIAQKSAEIVRKAV